MKALIHAGRLLRRAPAVGLLMATLAPAVAVANPFAIESRCEFLSDVYGGDKSSAAEARICNLQTAKATCEKYVFCWWRDTTAQNSLGDLSDVYGVPLVRRIYTGAGLTVMLYRSAAGANVVALVGSTEMYLIGAGGSVQYANQAKLAFQANYGAGFMSKHLKGIVLPSADATVALGVTYWRNLFGSQVPLVVSAEFDAARARAALAAGEANERDVYVYGQDLLWGPDEFLGIGSGREYRPVTPGYAPTTINDMFLSGPMDLSVNGIPITVTPALSEVGGLSVYLPWQQVLIPIDLFGPYLPDIAPLNGPALSVDAVDAELHAYLAREAVSLVFMHGDYVAGQQDVAAVLTVGHDALSYLKDQTLTQIGYHTALEDIVSVVKLPPSLANSPFAQQYVGKVEHIVRAIYHEYLGWFDGRPASIATLPAAEHARRLVEMAGGESNVLSYAERCMTDQSTNGVKMALEVLTALRQIYPSERADALYVQALKMLAWREQNARVRNYYLTEVLMVVGDPVTVYSPPTSTTWTIGSTETIVFVSHVPTAAVNILLSRDGGKTWTLLFANVPNTGSYVEQAWPVTGPATAKAIVKIETANDPNLYSTSGVFSIVDAP